MRSLLIVLLFAVAFVVSRTVTGKIRNEFQDPLVLADVQLQSGTWVKQPLQSVDVSTAYGPLFIAGGNLVSGYVHYTAENAFVNVKIYFLNTATNSSYTINVGPSPFIGGVDTVTGAGDSVVPYWVHEMCFSKDANNRCIKP